MRFRTYTLVLDGLAFACLTMDDDFWDADLDSTEGQPPVPLQRQRLNNAGKTKPKPKIIQQKLSFSKFSLLEKLLEYCI